jgi:AhpD family alkylhydroperoxidase
VRKFRRRFYRRPSEVAGDVRLLVREYRHARKRKGSPIDGAFRERLMLAVTEVNGCRYCAYAHARLALAAGVTSADIQALTQGDLRGAPSEQVPALLYAQHWAESDARPDAGARDRVLDMYGEEKTQAIELTMRSIRLGNLLGNTADYLLYRLSFGWLGDGER